MNISYNWLKQYIDLPLGPEETAAKLTSLGLEVGAVETTQTIKGGLAGLIVAQVLTCEEHPDSDHLHVTTVDFGGETPVQVVCGAPNCRKGLKTILATIGTKLYDGDKEFAIKKSKIRGVESFGMLCAEDEIGIGSSHDGIIELPDDAVVGTPAKTYYHIEDDALIEVDITPNRADAISHYGVARDLAAALGKKAVKPSVEAFKVNTHDRSIRVKVENEKACPRYTGLTILGVEVKESPDWLKQRLTSIGQRPINNIVDITNFIINELGQPLHCFDADQIAGDQVIVRNLPEGTPFVTLDGVERKLSANDLVICNPKEGMCLAGVFGGLKSGVTEKTKNVFIESAYFDPVTIRKTARRHGLNTDASFRYERGCDPNICVYALKRAALLIQELAGGIVSGDIIDLYPNPVADFQVTLRYDKVNSLIGKELSKTTVKNILEGLEIRIDNETDDELQLSVPPYRVDVQRDVDVIEDILRVYGYDNIQPNANLKSSISYSTTPDSTRLQNRAGGQLTGEGFMEIMNNSLTKLSYYTGLTSYPAENAVRIMNPLGSDLSVMRQTLLMGGLESIAHNRNRRRFNLKFYEFGACYHYHAENRNVEKPLKAYSEENHLALWMCGNTHEQSWTDAERKVNFFDLKGYVTSLLTRLGIPSGKYVSKPYQADIYRQAIRLETYQGKVLATIGIVSDQLLRDFDIDTEVFYADLEWKAVLQTVGNHKMLFSDIAKFPEVKRDLALLLDQDITFEQVEKTAYEVERKLLKKVVLFDVYEGKNLEPGKKSYAVSFTLQDANKTLDDRQIDSIMQRLIQAYEQKLGAKIR
ncbi:MAG: phenylalanine--tRNA ligase subunit beta [Paludibacteraceae bacterium]|nr:phenylalanine--tRNA ligase subunit beta [Paludibacteraceae bacterium]